MAAFVTEGGLAILEKRAWFGASRAGARIRLVTGDYLGVYAGGCPPAACSGWSHMFIPMAATLGGSGSGAVAVRVVETAMPDGSERAFHPKSWRFDGATSGVAFVGSSNFSRSALETGIEWNLRVERAVNPVGYGAVCDAFEKLWTSAIELTSEWIDAYELRVRQRPRPLPLGDGDEEALAPPPTPHEFQEEALAALAEARIRDGDVRWWCSRRGWARPGWLPSMSGRSRRRPDGGLAYCSLRIGRSCSSRLRGPSVACWWPRINRRGVGWCAGDLMEPDAACCGGLHTEACPP